MTWSRIGALLMMLLVLSSCESESDLEPVRSAYFLVTEDGYEQHLDVPGESFVAYRATIGVVRDGRRFDETGMAEVLDMLSDPPTKLHLSKEVMQMRSAAGFESERCASLILNTVTIVGIDLKKRAPLPDLPNQAKEKKRNQVEYLLPSERPRRQGLDVVTPKAKRWKTVVMYSATWCPSCKTARRWLDSNGVRYSVIDVSAKDNADPRYRSAARRAGSKVVPIFEIGANHQIMSGWSASEFERNATY